MTFGLLISILSPILLGALSFTAIAGKLHKTNTEGKKKLNRWGIGFLSCGILGVVCSTYINFENIKENEIQIGFSEELKKQIDTLSKNNSFLNEQNEKLLMSQQRLEDRNSRLLNLTENLTELTNSQNSKIQLLTNTNNSLLKEAKLRNEKLSDLKASTEKLANYERLQANSAEKMANIANEEHERKQRCLRTMQYYESDEDMLRMSNCSDFIKPIQARGCIGGTGVGQPCYSGVGGPMYRGVGGACYAGVGGPCYRGLGGDMRNCPARCL